MGGVGILVSGGLAVSASYSHSEKADYDSLCRMASAGSGGNQVECWKGLILHIQQMNSTLEDMRIVGPEERAIYKEQLLQARAHFESLQRSLDQVLVFVSVRGWLPTS